MTRKFEVIGYNPTLGETDGTAISRVSVDITEEFDSSSKLVASTKLHDYEDVGHLIDDNQDNFTDPQRWRVNQPNPMERTGILNVKSVPYWVFSEFWRKPINIVDSALTPMGGGGIYRFMKPSYFGNCWNKRIVCWMNWVEVDNMIDRDEWLACPDKNPIFKFLYEHSPELYLFSDTDSIFPDDQIDFAYLGDFGIRG